MNIIHSSLPWDEMKKHEWSGALDWFGVNERQQVAWVMACIWEINGWIDLVLELQKSSPSSFWKEAWHDIIQSYALFLEEEKHFFSSHILDELHQHVSGIMNKNHEGRNCLFIGLDHPQLCQWLLEQGLRWDEPDEEGHTPLHEALNRCTMNMIFPDAQVVLNTILAFKTSHELQGLLNEESSSLEPSHTKKRI